MAGKRCTPPKSQGVKAHTRARPVQRKKQARARAAALPFVVRDSRNGRVVSHHKTITAAIRERKRLDLRSFRAGKGRPYETGRA